MTECGHLPPKPYYCVQCLLDELEAVEQHHCTLVAKIDEQQVLIGEAVKRMVGTVEGRPTTTDNFLQRIDELTKIEARVMMYAIFANDPILSEFANNMLKGDKCNI